MATEQKWTKGNWREETGECHLELGQALDGLQWPQDSENPQGLDGLDVPALIGSAEKPQGITGQGRIKEMVTLLHWQSRGKRLETGSEYTPSGRPPRNKLWENFPITPQGVHTHMHAHPCMHVHPHTHVHSCRGRHRVTTEVPMHTC